MDEIHENSLVLLGKPSESSRLEKKLIHSTFIIYLFIYSRPLPNYFFFYLNAVIGSVGLNTFALFSARYQTEAMGLKVT